MIKAPVDPQDLGRGIYAVAKADPGGSGGVGGGGGAAAQSAAAAVGRISLGAKRAGERSAGRSSRQDCNPAGGSPAVTVARVGHVAIPHPGWGNLPGYAWCTRPGCQTSDDASVGATWRSSEWGRLKRSE
jgi:hypothetical protein